MKKLLFLALLSSIVFGCENKPCCSVSEYCYCDTYCSAQLNGGGVISMNLKVGLDSKEKMDFANYRMDKFKHAISITMPMYSYSQLKGDRLQRIVSRLAKEVFKDPSVKVVVSSVKFNL